MFRVVTLSGEYGSGGTEIAEIVGRELGWQVFDRRIIQEIAQAAGVDSEAARSCDERIDSLLHRMARSLWRAGSDRATSAPSQLASFDAAEMAALSRRVILQAAEHGNCIIVGRGGQCLLQNRTDALHVFVYAPEKFKRRWMRSHHPNDADVEAIRSQKDRERADYVKTYFGCNWCDRHLYDLMISACLGEERAANWIVHAVRDGARSYCG